MQCPYRDCSEEGGFTEIKEHRIVEHGEPRPAYMEDDADA